MKQFIILFTSILLIACNKENKTTTAIAYSDTVRPISDIIKNTNIKRIKKYESNDYPIKTIGEMIDSYQYFVFTEWNETTTKLGDSIVQVTAKYEDDYNQDFDKYTKIYTIYPIKGTVIIQMPINKVKHNKAPFYFSHIEINGVNEVIEPNGISHQIKMKDVLESIVTNKKINKLYFGDYQ